MSIILLDYGMPKPFGQTIGRERHLSWPVNAYRVTLPKVSQDDNALNAFERVVLKLIEAGGFREAKQLTTETCLPDDLIQCVLLRLRDKGYVDEYNQLIKQKFEELRESEEASPTYITALLFRELATGKILPYLQMLDDEPLKKREEENERRFWKIRLGQNYTSRTPIPRDVLSALRTNQKRAMAFGEGHRMPSVQQITIAPQSERYFLDCPIAIQKSDGEFRIADPFGTGFSLQLENAFSQLLESDDSLSKWMLNWRQNLSNPRQNKPDTCQKEVFETDENWGRYPKLIASLRPRRNDQHRSIQNIYASLEWALFYSCAHHSYKTAVEQLKLTNPDKHPDLFAESAKNIGFELPEGRLSSIPQGKLEDFLSGKAELRTVLALTFLIAKNDPTHPLRSIVNEFPDFVPRMFDIKNKRDEELHGSGRFRRDDVELPDDKFMRKVIATILPSIQFANTPMSKVDVNYVADSLLDARTSIQGEFGFDRFNRFGENTQNRLVNAERFWLECKDGDNALSFACDLYATLQNIFRQQFSGVLLPDVGDAEYAKRAEQNAKNCGLGEFSEGLRRVKRNAVRETLQGNDQTLGACVIVFLLTSDEEISQIISQTQPSFIADIEYVIDQRGHGNEPLPLTKDETMKLRKTAYTTIKTLQEI